jgi:hypothetical protein
MYRLWLLLYGYRVEISGMHFEYSIRIIYTMMAIIVNN